MGAFAVIQVRDEDTPDKWELREIDKFSRDLRSWPWEVVEYEENGKQWLADILAWVKWVYVVLPTKFEEKGVGSRSIFSQAFLSKFL